jgi:5,10-methylenetetrahydromethanopterin reductase
MNPELPRISIRLSGAIEPRRCIELAQAAETSGFYSVWFAENPFQRGIFATAGACAAATKHVRIGIGIINPYTRHPVQIAMDAAALDELSGGRAVLGIGSGISHAIDRMEFDTSRPVGAVRDAVTIVRGLLSGQHVTYRGKVFSSNEARLTVPPARPDLPIYLAAAGDRALRSSGEIADGLIVSNLTPLRSTARMVEIAAAAAAKADRPGPTIVQYLPCAVCSDSEAARQLVKTALGETLIQLWPEGSDWPQRRERVVANSGIPRSEFAAALDRLRRGENAAAALDERFVDTFAIAGTAEHCLHQAARYRAAGVDEIALTFAGTQPATDIAYLGRALAAS